MTNTEKKILKQIAAKMLRLITERDNPELCRHDQTMAKQDLLVEVEKIKSLTKI